MCLFKPNTYDPKDWQCPKPSCRTVNFKKRNTCISCGARKPDGSSGPLDDWRDGEKFSQGPWQCPECHTKNEAGAFNCTQCKRPSQEMEKLMEEDRLKRAAEEGRGGGLYDRQDPNDKKQWDSDGEEFDEFGRRKKKTKKTPSAPAAASSGPAAEGKEEKVAPGLSEKQRAALERLRSKGKSGAAAASDDRRDGRGGRRSRSRSRRRR